MSPNEQVCHYPSYNPAVIAEYIDSAYLKTKRQVLISLPRGYGVSDEGISYSVVIVLDGEDHLSSVRGMYDEASYCGMIQKPIVVGIPNPSVFERVSQFYPAFALPLSKMTKTEAGILEQFASLESQRDAFKSFIESEFLPYIDKTYKTNGERTLIGHSAGGYFAASVLSSGCALFNKYLIMCPALSHNNGELLDMDMKVSDEQDISVYIASNEEVSFFEHVDHIDALLFTEKLKETQQETLTVHYDFFPGEDHCSTVAVALLYGIRRIHNKTPDRSGGFLKSIPPEETSEIEDKNLKYHHELSVRVQKCVFHQQL